MFRKLSSIIFSGLAFLMVALLGLSLYHSEIVGSEERIDFIKTRILSDEISLPTGLCINNNLAVLDYGVLNRRYYAYNLSNLSLLSSGEYIEFEEVVFGCNDVIGGQVSVILFLLSPSGSWNMFVVAVVSVFLFGLAIAFLIINIIYSRLEKPKIKS